jgi:putative DNA primase/helicase
LPPSVAKGVIEGDYPELLVTEGEKKALKATQEGFPCIGLAGVFGWKDGKSERLFPTLQRIPWRGREVRIVFDSDIADKPEVQDGESRLAARLSALGARVKVVRLPAEGGSKVGLDDFLVAHGPGELRKLLDHAEDPTPPDPVTMRAVTKELDPATEGKRILEARKLDGVYRLRFWRGSFHFWRAGAYLETNNSEVRAETIRHLNNSYCKLRGSIVSDVVDQIRAQSLLPFSIDPPAWIGSKESRPAWEPTDVLSTRSGLVHLPSLVAGGNHLLPPTPRFFTPVSLGFDFDIQAPEPVAWLTFLAQLWGEDTESIGALQEWFGYCLTPDTSLQKILMVVGPKRSGKGTIARVLRQLAGPANMAGPTLASLATNFGLWPLLGKTVAIISDARLGGRTDSSVVVERLLSISGEDALTVDRKMLEPVTGKLLTRIMLLSNELPRLGDASGALAGRMIILRLTESFYGREDPGLTVKLFSELQGILLWAVEGWRRLQERGYFAQPESGKGLAGDLHDLSSPVSAFLRDCCEVGPACNVSRTDLYNAYKSWAESAGRQRKYVEDQVGFGRALRAAVPALGDSQHRVDGKRERFYDGVGLSLNQSFGG